jgi:hypothetical protein
MRTQFNTNISIQAFTLTSLSFLTVFINALLTLYRSRHQSVAPSLASLHQQPSFPIGPTSSYPSHIGSGYFPNPGWGRTWRGADDDDEGVPVRRRRLDGGSAAKIM